MTEKAIRLLQKQIERGDYDPLLLTCYDKTTSLKQRGRYLELLEQFVNRFAPDEIALPAGFDPQNPVFLFSTPGRTELGGNHTDHNHGKVLAAAVQLDTIAAVIPHRDNMIRVQSQGFPHQYEVHLDSLTKREDEAESTQALIRGIAARFVEAGCQVGGFTAYLMSDVLPGSGLSSSAAFEVLIGTILNQLYNQGRVTPAQLAEIGQYAENEYFGKPCGLMDQLACATGGIVAIDFKEPAQPVVQQLPYDFTKAGYQLFVVHTGGTHADLTADYAAIPLEMKSVARGLGKQVLREVSRQDLLNAAPRLRSEVGDRALLRAMHFLAENERVEEMVACLEKNDHAQYLQLVKASGSSSWRLLQNIFSPRQIQEQGMTLALALTEHFLQREGVCRVHGGGFAGTIQAYVPLARTASYKMYMEAVFGKNCLTPLTVRVQGTCCLLANFLK